jgi:multidrug efflux pump
MQLPVAPLPQIDFPVISVGASLPGASPETMASAVATPLERQFGRIAGINQMTSSSQLGSTAITMQFDLDRNIDAAARDVQAAINAARNYLPPALPSNPTYRKINPADAPVMILEMTSDAMTQDQMYDYADSIMGQKLSQVEGVGQVFVWGSSQPAVRIEANPQQAEQYGRGPGDAAHGGGRAERQSGQRLAGRWQQDVDDPRQRPAHQGERLQEPGDRLSQRRAGPPERRGRRSGFVFQHLQRGQLQRQAQRPDRDLPPAGRERHRHCRPRDRGAAIPEGFAAAQHQSANRSRPHHHGARFGECDVQRTLIISVILVVLVVFVFLREVRATLIPSVAVPLAIVGTFGIMYLCGYSLNNLSLMALTISTGFVVDDAIVVLENVMRHIEGGMKPYRRRCWARAKSASPWSP